MYISISRNQFLIILFCLFFCGIGIGIGIGTGRVEAAAPAAFESVEFGNRIVTFVENYCLDCHDGEITEAGLDLEVQLGMEAALAGRHLWMDVLDRVESGMMPPPRKRNQPSRDARAEFIAGLRAFLMLPEPEHGETDPGKPVLRRLNRLEYNNTVRDLLGLGMGMDIFMFPERLPVDRKYFDPAAASFPDRMEIWVREYGARYPVLLPESGLPGDNRAAHGFNNRGDAMNVSPLQLEKYLALAGEIVDEPTLIFRSRVFADFLGVDPSTLPPPETMQTSVGIRVSEPTESDGSFAPNDNIRSEFPGSHLSLEAFRRRLEESAAGGVAAVFGVPSSMNNATVAGKGGLIRVTCGPGNARQVTVNPNQDLWLASFSTAHETSGSHLITNRDKGQKDFELTLEVRDGDEREGVTAFGFCVLSRAGRSGPVRVVATMSDNSTAVLEKSMNPGPGEDNAFGAFCAPDGTTIKKVRFDGTSFSGDYLLLDDMGFITNGQPDINREVPQVVAEPQEVTDTANAVTIPETPSPGTIRRFPPPRQRIRDFMERAFRRPVSTTEVDRLHTAFLDFVGQGMTESAALKTVARVILASPSFLFLAEEPVPDGTPYRKLNDFELATRLSYFLWASMPDERLLDMARDGRLSSPSILKSETERVLQSPKIRELSESFAVQWLRLDQLYTAKPDPKLHRSFYAGPQGKNTLHSSMLMEALLHFESVMIENRPILDLIDPDFAWLNPRLMRHYGMEDRLEAVSLTDGRPGDDQWFRVPVTRPERGGIMTMAGPLTVTSLPFRTSPVKRGAWILETLFNRPPPEPKIAFALRESAEDQSSPDTIREKFERHRTEDACFNCHNRIDPPGFALEAFDATGGFRTIEAGKPVDTASEWNGSRFDGPGEFRKLLRDNPREFLRGFTEHLLSYALARELEYHDIAAVESILEATEDNGFRLRDIIHAIVTSRPFQWTGNSFHEESAASLSR